VAAGATVLVRGSGDVGSAVAHLLLRCGHGVVLHDVERPAAPRRGMAFADAIFDGECRWRSRSRRARSSA
jgi:xanthine dehydrogenase accessory factor